MKNKIGKFLLILSIIIIGVTACGNKEDEAQNQNQENETLSQNKPTSENEVEVIEEQESIFTEEEKLAVGRELLDIWYVKRLSATEKEELNQVRDIFKYPEDLKGSIEVFFDNGIAGKFENITLQLDNERTIDMKEKVFYYEAEATVSSVNKETGDTESFKEIVKMMVEQNEDGKFKIQDIKGSMLE